MIDKEALKSLGIVEITRVTVERSRTNEAGQSTKDPKTGLVQTVRKISGTTLGVEVTVGPNAEYEVVANTLTAMLDSKLDEIEKDLDYPVVQNAPVAQNVQPLPIPLSQAAPAPQEAGPAWGQPEPPEPDPHQVQGPTLKGNYSEVAPNGVRALVIADTATIRHDEYVGKNDKKLHHSLIIRTPPLVEHGLRMWPEHADKVPEFAGWMTWPITKEFKLTDTHYTHLAVAVDANGKMTKVVGIERITE